MKKKLVMLFLCIVVGLTACGKDSNEENIGKNNNTNIVEEDKNAANSQETENMHTGEATDTKENAVESIEEEIARIEEQSREHCAIDTSNMVQVEMNYHSAQWYELWDNELNSLWSRLSKELDADTKAKVLEEQRAWIKRKEGNVVAAGVQALGGSLRPLLESETAAEMTRARVYVLANYLADVRNESFTISTEIQESLDKADPRLDDVFAKFQGKWIFDERRGACVGVERTETCVYAVEGSDWTVWVTGGDLFSDLDVYGYTEQNILFKLSSGIYYELAFGMEGEVLLTYMPSLELEAFNDFETIIGYALSENMENDYSGLGGEPLF